MVQTIRNFDAGERQDSAGDNKRQRPYKWTPVNGPAGAKPQKGQKEKSDGDGEPGVNCAGDQRNQGAKEVARARNDSAGSRLDQNRAAKPRRSQPSGGSQIQLALRPHEFSAEPDVLRREKHEHTRERCGP
jgi:hypothetical protein